MANDGLLDPSGNDDAAWLRLAVSNSGTGIWDRDVISGRITYSSAWKKMLGYADAEISPSILDSYTRVHPDDLARTQTAILNHFAGRTDTYQIEHRLRCKDGSYKWVLSRGKVVSRGAEGEALRMIGMTTDISATVALSDELRQSSDLLVSLTNEVPGLVYQYQIDSAGRPSYTYASAGIVDIFGATPEQAAQDPFIVEAAIHPDDIATYRGSMAISAATLERWQLEFRVVLPNIGERWREVDARPRRTGNGGTVWHGFVSDITDHKRLEQQLQDAAATDFLTGMPNRRSIMERMEQELARIKRDPHETAAVLMFDLDHFKGINDRFGHATGDDALKHFSAALQHELRKQDSAGRIGGEEFAVILSGTGMHEAVGFAQRVRARLAEMPLYEGKTLIPVTASVGVATIQASDINITSTLARADASLYLAKQGGRDRIESDMTV